MRDAYGNVVPCSAGTSDLLQLELGDAPLVGASCPTGATSPFFYRIDFTPILAGTLRASVFYMANSGDTPTPQDNVRGSPVDLVILPGPPIAGNSGFDAPTDMTAGTSAVVWVTLRDARNNIVPCASAGTLANVLDITTNNAWLQTAPQPKLECVSDDWRVRATVVPLIGGLDGTPNVVLKMLQVRIVNTLVIPDARVNVWAGPIDGVHCELESACPPPSQVKAGMAVTFLVRARDVVRVPSLSGCVSPRDRCHRAHLAQVSFLTHSCYAIRTCFPERQHRVVSRAARRSAQLCRHCRSST